MDERVLTPTHSIEYCEVLDEYITCLNKTGKGCLGTLAYHSAHSASLRRWKRFDCEVFDIEAYRRQERCHFWPSTHDESQLRFCSVFGHLHLRAFDGYFETCNILGARPLVDNRFFLIQVTAKPLNGLTGPPILTKVTVIVKASDHCTRQKQFEAASEETALPRLFTDGTSGEELNGEKVLQLVHRSDHVEIRMRHVSSVIRIRRHGPYLGVSVRIPERLLHADYEGVNERQLCEAGCSSFALDVAEAFAYPEVYLRCHYATSPMMAMSLALARCRRLNATDEFFEACVFDLMTSADEMLARLANDGYLDFRTLMPRTSHSSGGRQELEEYDNNAERSTELCKGSRFQESWNPSSGNPESTTKQKMAPKRKSDDDRIPVVEKLYRENQESYKESGGFDEADDEREERRERISEAMQKKRDRAFEDMQAPENCVECEKPLFDSLLWERFNYPACDTCRDEKGNHKLVAKTEAKKEYLLKDCDFDIRKPPLRFVSKKNPHNPRYGDMKLYLKLQVEQRALEVYGTWDALEDARKSKAANREVIAERRFEKKIKEMRKEVRGFSHIKIDVGAPHEHEYGEESHDAEKDEYWKECKICKYRLSYEKM